MHGSIKAAAESWLSRSRESRCSSGNTICGNTGLEIQEMYTSDTLYINTPKNTLIRKYKWTE